mgnify:CR=1 FL=1
MQFEEAAKRVSQKLQSHKEDGSEPDVKDVQVMLFKEKTDGPLGTHLSMRDIKVRLLVHCCAKVARWERSSRSCLTVWM